jgi:thiosulfate/3-mercaptopyruvate sulfurtransferase
MRRIRNVTAITALAATAALPMIAQAQQAAADSMIVTTQWLAAHLNDPKVVIVAIERAAGDTVDRIPGARILLYSQLAVKRGDLTTELPGVISLRTLVESLGITNDSRVVVYATMAAPMATRLLMTLDYLGHRKFSYLDGGMPKWKSEGRAVVRTEAPTVRSAYTPCPRPDMIADADWIVGRLGKPGTAFIDTRTLGEYNGSGNRSGMPSAGHLEGAQNLEWEWLFRADNPLQLKDRIELQKLYDDRARAGDTVVTYCWIGYRASATYFVARALGRDAKFYDGSYQDWQLRKLPTVAGEKPQ